MTIRLTQAFLFAVLSLSVLGIAPTDVFSENSTVRIYQATVEGMT